MSTCDRVDLPEPFGPMTACTSPDRTTRSMPWRISLPATLACRSVMTSSAIDAHHDPTVLDTDLVRRHCPRGRQRLGLAVDERERAAVLPALERAVVAVHLAFAEGDVGVRAA